MLVPTSDDFYDPLPSPLGRLSAEGVTSGLQLSPAVVGCIQRPMDSVTSGTGTLANLRPSAALQIVGSNSSETVSSEWIEGVFQALIQAPSLEDRVAAAQALKYPLPESNLDRLAVAQAASYLIRPTRNAAARKAGMDLIKTSLRPRPDSERVRHGFFRILTGPCHPDDFYLQLANLNELTGGGSDLAGFERLIFPILADWLGQLFNACLLARQARRRQTSVVDGISVIDRARNLQQLFSFLGLVIRLNACSINEADISLLIEQLIDICTQTTTHDDLKNAVNTAHILVTVCWIPSSPLYKIIETLCTIHCLVKQLRTQVMSLLEQICLLQSPHDTITMLYHVLQSSGPGSDTTSRRRRRRGAIPLLEHLFQSTILQGIFRPSIPLTVHAIKMSNDADDSRIQPAILSLLVTMMKDVDLTRSLFFSDWYELLRLVALLLGLPIDDTLLDEYTESHPSSPPFPLKDDRVADSNHRVNTIRATMNEQIMRLVQQLQSLIRTPDFVAKEEAIDLLLRIEYLPDEAADMVIRWYAEERLCRCSSSKWQDDYELLATTFVHTHQSGPVRLLALGKLHEAYILARSIVSDDALKFLALVVLGESSSEPDLVVYEGMVTFLLDVADTEDSVLFDWVVECLQDRLSPSFSPARNLQVFQSSLDSTVSADSLKPTSFEGVAAKGFASLFVQSLVSSAARALLIYEVLIELSKTENMPADARIAAMQALMRLRADGDERIYLASHIECSIEATYLARVKPSSSKHGKASPPNSPSVEGDDPVNASMTRPDPDSGTRADPILNREPIASSLLWQYPEELPWVRHAVESATCSKLYLAQSTSEGSQASSRQNSTGEISHGAKISDWLIAIISSIQKTRSWEVRSYLLVHLGAQLSNVSLFRSSKPAIVVLMNTVYDQIRNSSYQEPPQESAVRKADVALCLYQIAIGLIPHHPVFGKSEQEELVKTLVIGLDSRDVTSRICIQALAICCFELPTAVSKHSGAILQKLSKIVTQTYVAVHVLEFLALLARRPQIYSNFREQDFKTIFGISFQYLRYVMDKRYAPRGLWTADPSGYSARHVRLPLQLRRLEECQTLEDLPQYVYALAYHVITFWFMRLKMEERPNYVSYIAANLVFRDPSNKEVIDDQSEVTVNMMSRVTYCDQDQFVFQTDWASKPDVKLATRTWIVYNSVITIETDTITGRSKITRREPSGTSYFTFDVKTNPLPASSYRALLTDELDTDGWAQAPESRPVITPSYVFLQMNASAPPRNLESAPVPLPEDGRTEMFLRIFDQYPTLDSHRVGVIYVGDGQREEAEILANTRGSEDYAIFLERLGELRSLKDARCMTSGLDRSSDSDGQYTICWADRVTELMFHVTTLMPTDQEEDPKCIEKKKHIGNDFVNIIYNDSNTMIDFDTFPSAFNFVNIVITPEARLGFTQTRMRTEHERSKLMYKIEVTTKPGLPKISPVAESKMVSMSTIPALVRLLAINASVFSLVWANKEGGEHVSSWRNRLREIKRMRTRHAGHVFTPTSPEKHNSIIDQPPIGSVSMVGSGISQTLSSALHPATRRASAVMRSNDHHPGQDHDARLNAFIGTGQRLDANSSSTSQDTQDSQFDERLGTLTGSLDFTRWT